LFIPSNFLHSTLAPFFQWVLDFYSFLYREHSNHIQVLSFPTPPRLDLSLERPVFHTIAIFVLGLYSTYESMQLLAFWVWLTSLKMMLGIAHKQTNKKVILIRRITWGKNDLWQNDHLVLKTAELMSNSGCASSGHSGTLTCCEKLTT
jgi:hypothetical protein